MAATPITSLGPARPVRLGARLRAVLELCPPDGPVADVGSGHGRLALELKRRRPELTVVATEVCLGPQRELDRLLHPGSGVRVLWGDGLLPLVGLGCHGVVIAGMGGPRIAAILERGGVVARSLAWACVQPAQRERPLREWLGGAGWRVLAETEVQERAHRYPTLLVQPQ
ncbi:MAG: tRNA (adenine(22)-N(1))-methyltransferase TrmK [Candidatus Dormibacteria bacterium]